MYVVPWGTQLKTDTQYFAFFELDLSSLKSQDNFNTADIIDDK